MKIKYKLNIFLRDKIILTTNMLDDKVVSIINEIKCLKDEIREKEKLLSMYLSKNGSKDSCKYSQDLSSEEITRYSRQMLVADIGISGQMKLRNSKVLIVGAGGLGCPAATYLAGAGVGEITIADYDEVELSNLHRQILHTEDDIDLPKVESAYDKLHSINRSIKIIPLKQHINSDSVKQLLDGNNYDVVIDGSDNVATRYLLNDACVLYGIPLVSGSALQSEAQLTVYNYKCGPCYRCLFPLPPPPETVTSCGDGGVIGPVPGLIGVLQAFQAIKIVVNADGVLSGRFLLFDGSNMVFRNVTLRPRDVNCAVCGDNPTIRELIDYEQFCRASAHDKVVNINILNEHEQIHARDLAKQLGSKLILDVRPNIQFDMCHLPHTINVPLSDVLRPDGVDRVRSLIKNEAPESEVFILCRRGNDSQRAVSHLKEALSELSINFVNVAGGLHAYSEHVDSEFPVF